MAHTFMIWLDRFLFPVRATVQTLRTERPPMKIEIQCLPDYLWRELGFPPPRRPDRE